MFKFCAGHANRFRHLWVEVYVWLPSGRTLVLMWTRGMWRHVSVSRVPFKVLTGSL